MISKEDRRILSEFSHRLFQRFQDVRIWAFGSRGGGDASWDSDFDICIVLDHTDDNIDQWIRDVAWEVGFENERVITTVVLDKYQFQKGPISESTLVANILQEGISA